MWEGDRPDLSRGQGPEGTVRDAMSPVDGGREGWVLGRMAIGHDIRRAGAPERRGPLTTGCRMTEMSAKFRAKGGVWRCEVAYGGQDWPGNLCHSH